MLELQDLLTTRWQDAAGSRRQPWNDSAILPVIQAVPIPAGFTATLRPYQQHGLELVAAPARTRASAGFLADEMGLGKTAQTIAHICRRMGTMRAGMDLPGAGRGAH